VLLTLPTEQLLDALTQIPKLRDPLVQCVEIAA
jgi:hypothetical protein